MRMIFLLLAISLFSLPAFAQDTSDAAPLEITERDVRVVQQELYRRGYLASPPTGVLDQKTRVALRAFQERENLEVTGKIDEPTVIRLGLIMPLSANPLEDEERRGFFPSIGNAIRDGVVKTGRTAGKTASKIGNGVKTGAEATVGATGSAAGKARDTTKSAGATSAEGARAAGRGVESVADDVGQVLVGRSDVEIQQEVREVLNESERTRYLRSEVREGRVMLIVPLEQEGDFSSAITEIRQIKGVKSVVVVNR